MKTFSTKLTLLTIIAFASASSTQTVDLSSMHKALIHTASACAKNAQTVVKQIDALPVYGKVFIVCWATLASHAIYLVLSGKISLDKENKHSEIKFADTHRNSLKASHRPSKSTTFAAPKKATTSETKEAKYQKERKAAAERYYDYR